MSTHPTLRAILVRGLLAAALCTCGGAICGRTVGHATVDEHGRLAEHEPAHPPATYRCPTCRRWWPWCVGAADEAPEICDECWCDGTKEMTR